MTLLSESLASAIYEQVAHEIANSQLYFYIYSYLKNKGLNNISRHFEEQTAEEHGHAKLLVDFLLDLNIEVKLLEIPAVEVQFNTIGDIAKAYLEREIATTDSLNSIKLLAIEENSPVCEEFLRKLIAIQQQEYSEATDFADKSELLSDWGTVLLWDLSLK